jgi:hypothetical protein
MSRHGMQRVTGLLCAAMFSAAIVSSAYGQTRVIPAITVSEAYDTNVYFTTSGGHLQDYVTTTTPQVRVDHKSRLVDGTAQVSIPGSVYVNNPGLNYIATNASFNVGLDQLTGLVDKRWKLTVMDFITYTPQPPAFFTPQPGVGTVTSTTPQAPENFVRGVQAVRANSLINVGAITSRYVLTPVTTLTAGFQNQYMQFGRSYAATPGAGFFTTMFTTLNAGPQFQVTQRDVINANFNYSNMSFSQGSGSASTFSLEGATVGWSRTFSPKLSANASAGATVFSGGGNLQYLASASVTYQERNTSFIGSYSRSVFPSFFIAATPLLSQVITGAVTHRFTGRLTGSATLNYGKNEAIGSTALQFDTYGASAGLSYAIGKTWSVSANYSHLVTKNTFNGENFNFDRDVISVTFRKEWPDFFQPK